MVFGLKPMGKPSTKKENSKVLDRTKALYGPRTQAYGETKYKKENSKILDRTKALYGPQTQAYGETKYLKEKLRTLKSIRGELPINSWVNPYAEWILQSTLGSSVPKGLMQYKAIYYRKHN